MADEKRYTLGEGADLYARPDFPRDEVVKRLRYLASGCGSGVSLLNSEGHTRGTGPTAPRVYALPEVCKWGVLFDIQDFRIVDVDLLRQTVAALSNHRRARDGSISERSEIERAIDAIIAGDQPLFALTKYRHPGGGSFVYPAMLIDPKIGGESKLEPPKEPAAGSVEGSTYGIQLRPLIWPILSKIGIIRPQATAGKRKAH